MKAVVMVVTVAIVAACGSSKKVVRRQQMPDGTVASLGHGGSKKATSQTKTSKKATTANERLALRIDSLLQAEDSLLTVSQLGLHIVNLTTGEVVYSYAAQQRMRPASTEKVVTAITALDVLGPHYQFQTQLLTTAPLKDGVLQGDLYIKGGMDPLLTAADVGTLAARLKAAGVRRVTGRLLADASLKDEDEYGWGWCWDDDNPTLTPLLLGGKPGLAAQMLTALRNAGITLAKGVAKGVAPATARCLAAFYRPLAEVLLPMMKESDNLYAESVFYQLRPTPGPSRNGGERLAQGKHYSRKSAAGAVENVIERAYSQHSLPSMTGGDGGGSLVADGSGLSLYNYQTPEVFTRLLAYAVARPDSIFNPLLEALPIAGIDGTLKKRMTGTPAAANVRAKTGSVTAVSTLVGYTTQRSTNQLMAFAIMNQGVSRMAEGRNFQDKVCVLMSE